MIVDRLKIEIDVKQLDPHIVHTTINNIIDVKPYTISWREGELEFKFEKPISDEIKNQLKGITTSCLGKKFKNERAIVELEMQRMAAERLGFNKIVVELTDKINKINKI